MKTGELRLVMVDDKNKPRVMLTLDEDGDAGLTMTDNKGKPRAMLAVTGKGEPLMSLLGPDNKVLFMAP